MQALAIRTAFVAVALVAAGAARAHSPDPTRLPLGDGKISDHPEQGYIWACHTNPNGNGAYRDGPWIDSADGTFDKTRKAVVDGDVGWQGFFEESVKGDRRFFVSNDLPADYATGIFPVSPNDDAYQYDRNPNHIAEQTMRFDIPANPVLLDTPSCAPGTVGILLSGVVVFNALDDPGRDAVAHETQDSCEGHPQRGSVYHHHDVSGCVLEKYDSASGPSKLVGYAVDGFGIFGPRDENGVELSSSDLDECHGRTSEIEWDGKKVVMYHYVATLDFPYTIGCLRGAYDQATLRTISGQAMPQSVSGQGPRPGGEPDLNAAARTLGISLQALRAALGPPPPDLAAAAAKLGIAEGSLQQALGVR